MKQKLATYGFLLLASLCLATFLTEIKGDDWENRIRSLVYRVKDDTIPVYARELTDDMGVPFVFYAKQNGIEPGPRYNPTIVANRALEYHEQLIRKQDQATVSHFRNCIQYLSDSMTRKNGYAYYRFNWQQPFYPKLGFPFTSGMSSGRAIAAFTMAFRYFHDSLYLLEARHLLRGFYIPVEDSGFTYKSGNGWWYEEFAFPHSATPRILDGHIYALLGIHDYWKAINDDSAKFLFNQGIRALKEQLPFYDAGSGKVYYDSERHPADQHYHEILSRLMMELAEKTGDPVFLAYHHRWQEPLDQPYLVRMLRLGNRSGILLYSVLAVCSFLILYLLRRILK